VKKEFLEGVDKRVSLKIEPWEIEAEPEPIVIKKIDAYKNSAYNYYDTMYYNEMSMRIIKPVKESIKMSELFATENERGIRLPKPVKE